MSDEFPVTIYHNPACGTSRNTLAIIRAAGYEPAVVEYLETGWSSETLKELSYAMKTSLREMMREKGTPAQALGLLEQSVSDEKLLAAMVAHPILVNRPIVVTPKGTALCRPSEAVFDLLERKPESFTKEDGEVVKPSNADRLRHPR